MQKQMNNSELYQIVGFDAEYVERSASAKGNLFQTARTTTQCVDTLSPGLERIRQAAKRDSKTRFSGLLHHMTPDLLSGAYRSLNPKSVPGVDEMTWQAYGKGLDERLRSLHQRIQSGHYHAMPSKRIWIAKADGRKRPIGIAALEDKIVQKRIGLGTGIDLRNGFPGIQLRISPWPQSAQSLRCPACGDHATQGKLGFGCGHPRIL